MWRNRFSAPQKSRYSGGVLSNILAVIVFCGIIVLFNIGANSLTQTKNQERLEAVQTAVVKAVIQFYAFEGYYPPSIDYLTENYGLLIDHERYIVHYVHIASNLMPEIFVFPRDF